MPNIKTSQNQLFTLQEVSERFIDLTPQTLANYCRLGRIDGTKKDGAWHLSARAIAEFQQNAKRGYKGEPLAAERRDDGIHIPISGKEGEGKFAIVSFEDADLADHLWYIHSGYAARTEWNGGDREQLRMHRVVMERVEGRPLESEEEVDHIFGNKLDNRRDKLRITTASQNQQNRHARQGGTSKYKGVVKEGPYWGAYITFEGERRYLGSYGNEGLAAAVYDAEAKKLFGEYANLNFPET